MFAYLLAFTLLSTSNVDATQDPYNSSKNQQASTPTHYQSWCPIQVDLSVAFDDFRSLPEGSWTGNMGAFGSLNLKADLPYDFFLQVGGSYGVYDWDGRSSTPYKDSNTAQQQGFITGAFSYETPSDFGVNAGFAYDWMLNHNFGLFAVNPYLDQIRGQVGYLFLKRHEFGSFATYGIHTSKEKAEQISLKFKGISQVNLFYCNYFPKGGFAMLWGGTPYANSLMFSSGRPGSYILGARMSAPLTDYLSLYGHASFMGGRSTSTSSKSQNNASDACIGLTYSFGYRKIQQTPYMSIADNTNFMVDTNQNF